MCAFCFVLVFPIVVVYVFLFLFFERKRKHEVGKGIERWGGSERVWRWEKNIIKIHCMKKFD